MIENEKVKLTANWINGLSIAVFAVGGLAPLFSSLYDSEGKSFSAAVVPISVVCFFAAVALHYTGRRLLRGLKP